MALLLHYIGTVTWRQNKPPAWSKTYAGELDTCSITWQGAQYLEKAFLDSLTKYQTMTYVDEAGVSVTDTGMFLVKFSSDDNPIFPTVTLSFEGCRGGVVPDPVKTDDITTQSASTTKEIIDPTSPNYQKSITMAIQYYASRTTYDWVQLTDPAGNSPYTTVRNPISYTGPFGDSHIFYTHFSGMFDAAGDPTNTISIADATAVWNSFRGIPVISGLNVKEVVPGKVWQGNATAEFLLIGS